MSWQAVLASTLESKFFSQSSMWRGPPVLGIRQHKHPRSNSKSTNSRVSASPMAHSLQTEHLSVPGSVARLRAIQPRSHPAPGSRAEGHRPCHQMRPKRQTVYISLLVTLVMSRYVNGGSQQDQTFRRILCSSGEISSTCQIKTGFGNHGKR